MRLEILEILACPACKSRVAAGVEASLLFCPSCRRSYELKNGVPLMLDEGSKREVAEALQATESGRHLVKEFTGGWSLKDRLERIIQPPKYYLDIDKGKIMRQVLDSKSDGRILELGSGRARLEERVVNLDIYPFPGVDVVGDGHKLPFVDESFDGVISQALLEHVRNPILVVQEMCRVSKPGGLVYADVPFLQHFHGFPMDYHRWTVLGLEELFGAFEKIEVGVMAGPSSLMSCLFRDYLGFFVPRVPLLRTVLPAVIGWLTFPIKYLDLYLVRRPEAHKMALSLYYLGRKPAPARASV